MKRVKAKKFKEKKGGLKERWKKAKKDMEEQGDIFGITIEDGRYIADLTGAEMKESAAGWKYIEFEWTVAEGDEKDEKAYNRSGIETEDNLMFLMRDFSRLGVDIDDLDIEDQDDLEEVLGQLVKAKPHARIVAKTNDAGYQNIFINKLLNVEETAGESNGDDELEKGDRVSAEIDGKTYEGEITKIKNDVITVKFDDDDVETYDDASDLTKLEEKVDWLNKTAGYRKGKKMHVGKIIEVDDDDDTFVMKTDADKKISGDISDLEETAGESNGDDELEKGDRVSAEIDGKTYEGEITKIKNDVITVKFDDDDVETYDDASDLTKLEEKTNDDDTAELEVGAKVEVDYKGKELAGTVKKINEKDEEVVVFLKKTKKKVTVPVSDVTILG